MTNEIKLVKDVFKDYDEKGHMLECQVINVSLLKKSNKLIIDLKSINKIQIGEKLAFEFYLKNKFRVQDVEINIDVEEQKVQKGTKDKKENEDTLSNVIIGNRNARITDKIIKVKDVGADTGKVTITGKVIKKDIRELKTGKFLFMLNVYDGTSTITCKAFVEAKDKDKILEKLKFYSKNNSCWKCTI